MQVLDPEIRLCVDCIISLRFVFSLMPEPSLATSPSIIFGRLSTMMLTLVAVVVKFTP